MRCDHCGHFLDAHGPTGCLVLLDPPEIEVPAGEALRCPCSVLGAQQALAV